MFSAQLYIKFTGLVICFEILLRVRIHNTPLGRHIIENPSTWCSIPEKKVEHLTVAFPTDAEVIAIARLQTLVVIVDSRVDDRYGRQDVSDMGCVVA